MSFLKIAARRILCIALVLTPGLANVASAQQCDPNPPPYGCRQSPIDITAAKEQTGLPTFDTRGLGSQLIYTLKNTTDSDWCEHQVRCKGKVDNRWASLKAIPDTPAPRIKFGDSVYTLKEFHFHTPAEHFVNGVLTRAEAHFVFLKDGTSGCSSKYLVIGQRITAGEVGNVELDKIFDGTVKLPRNYHDPSPRVGIDISKLLTDVNGVSYRYDGSLTAPADLGCPSYPPAGPPGTPTDQLASGWLPEVVSWVLLEPLLPMTHDQIVHFQTLFPNGDARSPQDLNLRKVYKAIPPRP